MSVNLRCNEALALCVLSTRVLSRVSAAITNEVISRTLHFVHNQVILPGLLFLVKAALPNSCFLDHDVIQFFLLFFHSVWMESDFQTG